MSPAQRTINAAACVTSKCHVDGQVGLERERLAGVDAVPAQPYERRIEQRVGGFAVEHGIREVAAVKRQLHAVAGDVGHERDLRVRGARVDVELVVVVRDVCRDRAGCRRAGAGGAGGRHHRDATHL
jgi:hypothetical protein